MKKHTHIDHRQKLFANLETHSNGCWVWRRYKDSLGYGKISINGRATNVHRFAWALFRGPIPANLVIDHLCKNTSCANPNHLRVTTNRENVLTSSCPPALNALKTHCPKGHEFTPENTSWANKTQKRGRQCRQCRLKFKGLGWRKTLTHCKHGHPFDEANTYLRRDSRNGKIYRMCKRCHALTELQRYRAGKK